MSHYRSNLRDIRFNLFEMLDVGDRLGRDQFAELDTDTAQSILSEVERLAVGPIAASFVDSRPQPAGLRPGDQLGDDAGGRSGSRTGRIWTPNSGAWTCPRRPAAPPAPRSLWWAMVEMIQGAQAPVFMFGGGPGFAGLLYQHGHRRRRSASPT